MTRDEVLAKLAELPGTADGIAAFLAEKGITAIWGCSGRKCPVAKWCDPTGHVGVGVTIWNLYLSVSSISPRVAYGSLPHSVTEFVKAFDNMAYPELIA